MSVELLTQNPSPVVCVPGGAPSSSSSTVSVSASTSASASSSSTTTAASSSGLHVVSTKILLFDLDGTLVDSTAAVESFWTSFAHSQGLSPATILATSHGRRTVDVLNQHLGPNHPYDQPAILQFERDIPRTLGHKAKPVPGAFELLQSLPNKECWAIVTSGSRGLASGWLRRFGWREPTVFITSESVARGKPDPLGYTMAFDALTNTTNTSKTHTHTHTNTNTHTHQGKKRSLVFEDAPAGIRAGKASGAQYVVGLATTYDPETVRAAGADYVVKDMSHVRLLAYDPVSGELEMGLLDPIYTPLEENDSDGKTV